MSVIQTKQHTPPVRIAFAGPTCSGKSTMANNFYNHLVKKDAQVMKMSIAGPIKTIAKKKYGSECRKDWIMISMEVRAIDENHWINLLKKRIEEFDDETNIIIDDVRFQNEVGVLSTLGFKIVNMDIDWNIRFNRMVKRCGTNNPTLFTDTAKWFAAPPELGLLPKYFYEFTIKNDEDKYKVYDQVLGLNKSEAVQLENEKKLTLA
ncbi:MAG: hypothetical protein CMF41_01255 [Legionellales bacterium]|nr:hypothetical protein [Legionellales bacterium]|tara:strand:- start:2630 stop:3247 length:618 start_codon:yes stop_codon:yes gene_type:complete